MPTTDVEMRLNNWDQLVEPSRLRHERRGPGFQIIRRPASDTLWWKSGDAIPGSGHRHDNTVAITADVFRYDGRGPHRLEFRRRRATFWLRRVFHCNSPRDN